jgi:hypothetical protein
MQLIQLHGIPVKTKTMKFLNLFFILTLICHFAFAQKPNPVKWEYAIVKLNASEYELKAIAKIDPSWHLYAQNFDDGGPIRLTFTYEPDPAYDLNGTTLESPAPIMERDDIFEINVAYFKDHAEFTQKIKLKKPVAVKLLIEGQVCNDQSGVCIPINEEHTYQPE